MTFTAEHQSVNTFPHSTSSQNPLKTATGVYVTIHGHFYQPPRENPYLDTIERQPSAHPFHDWNQRIHFECYRPNAFARIVNEKNEVINIVNNFEYISFNIGPTLMSWLQNYDLEVYQRILEADRKSAARLNGHGNAIAQVYNHIILPLANKRDKYTQIRWGKTDFRHRFGRDPEGMWLAETAVDYATLEVLIDEGIKFIILAPSQAEQCRPITNQENSENQWHQVGGGQIDPTLPYRCFIPDGRYIDIFFYDGPISREMGFNDILKSADYFVGRLGQAIKGDHRSSQLISVATDGETFGHHKMGTEKCITYCCTTAFAQKGWTVTNYAHYLSISPPTWEVVLKPVTAWSCSHGVNRWQDDCGCGGNEEWQQKWRRPLRDSLNWLRDQLTPIYEEVGKQYFNDPWLARDEYIQVILDRSLEKVEQFLSRHQVRQLSPAEQIDALRLLEMQRHSLLMFTSCGWFFEELSRPEGTQILRYAARALELAAEISGVQLEGEFIQRLAAAPSNIDKYQDGAEVYRQLVIPAQISLEQVAAHYAISSLFNTYPEQHRVYCYDSQQLDYQKQQLGALTLAVGQVRLASEITWESRHFVFAVLHLGGWDFHCCIKYFGGRSDYSKIKEQLFDSLNQASIIQTVLEMSELFGNQSFSLQHLFAEERYRIMQQLTATTKKRLDQLYTQVYRDNYGILLAFQRDELPVPQELQVAVEVALSHRCLKRFTGLEQSAENPDEMFNHLSELAAIAAEANNLKCQLKIPEAQKTLERLIVQFLWQLLHAGEPANLEADIHLLVKLIEVGEQLHLELCLNKAQELYYTYLYQQLVPNCIDDSEQGNGYQACRWHGSQISSLLKLGQKLAINVSPWLDGFQ
jgi:alpha-amylase/alpha-mannosidase (GH57 family)